MNKASFLQRFAAWLIDQGILFIINLLLSAILTFVLTASDGKTRVPDSILALLSTGLVALFLVSQFVYFGYFWSARGRSIGMGLMNIKVVTTGGGQLSFLMAGLRGTIGYYISGLIFGLGYFWFFFDERKETWHDKIFGTNVFRG